LKDRQKNLEELCEQVKKRRETTGLTLDEISDATKIHRRFLEAIEEGRLERLPGLVYAKGFVRNYLSYIGAEDLFEEFENLLQADTDKMQTETLVNYMPPQKGFQKTSRWWLWASLLVVIGVSIFIFWQQRDELLAKRESTLAKNSAEILAASSGDQASEEDVAKGLPVEEKIQAPLAGEEAEVAVETGAEGIPVAVPKDERKTAASSDEALTWLPGGEKLQAELKEDAVPERKLVIRASGACWIRVTKNDEILFQGTLRNGDTHEVTIDAPTRVRYGNAGAVRHSWDGRDLGRIGGSGEVLTIEYLPDGSRNRL
jgi:cytoskeletal protein RodZ